MSPRGSEFATTKAATAHDAWVCAKVSNALASTASVVPNEDVLANAKCLIKARRDALDRLVC
jgi:hypothetical protein